MRLHKKRLIRITILTAILLFSCVGLHKVQAETQSNETTDNMEAVREAAKPISINLDGITYELPVELGDLVDDGWIITIDLPMKMESFETYNDVPLMKGDLYITASIINQTAITTTKVEDLLVYGLEGSCEVLRVNDERLEGIKTVQEVKKAIGAPYIHAGSTTEPANGNPSKESGAYHYYEIMRAEVPGSYYATSGVTFRFGKGGEIWQTQIESVFLDEEEILDETEQALGKYNTPKKLGNEILDYRFELEGTLYQMPVPVEVMWKNGWSIEINGDTIDNVNYPVAGDAIISAQLIKDKKSIEVLLCNMQNTVQRISNIYIGAVIAQKSTTANLVLPGKRKTGNTLASVIKNYAKDAYRTYPVKDVPQDEYGNVVDLSMCWPSISLTEFYNSDENYTMYDFYHFLEDQGDSLRNLETYFDGIVSFGGSGKTVEKIVYGYVPGMRLGELAYSGKETDVEITSEEEAKQYFAYRSWGYGRWYDKDGRKLCFFGDNMYSIDNGEEWFTDYARQYYSIDIKKQIITLTNGFGTIEIGYQIINSDQCIFLISDRSYIMHTDYVTDKTPDFKNGTVDVYLGKKSKPAFNEYMKNVTNVTYTSNDSKIAKVNKKGEITGVKIGDTLIWVNYEYKGTKCREYIMAEVKAPGIFFDQNVKTSMKAGKSQTIKASLGGMTGTIRYSVNSTSLATINSSTGKLTGKRKGTVTVTAACGKVKEAIKITIK